MEALQKATGGCGRFQWMMVASIKLGLMPIAWSMFQMTFGGMVPDWWCLPSTPDHHGNVSSSSNGYRGNWSRDNVTYQACGIPGSGGESCASHVVFDDSVNTVISEWSLVCERKYVKAMLTSLQMAGVFIGAVVAGQSSDAIGRRKTCYAALTWHLVTSLVAAFSVNWQMFLAMRILIGVSLGAYLVASFPYCFEFVGARHRQAVAFTPGWNTGASVFALGAWLLRDWSHLHIASALLTIPILLTWFPLQSTPVYTSLHQSTPVHTSPLQFTPVHTSLHQSTPHHTSLHQSTPVHTSPLQSTPVHTSLHQSTPHHTSPLQSTPLHTSLLHSTPVHTSLDQSTPHHTSPLQSTPVHTSPLQSTPSTPVHTSPHHSRPVHSSPHHSTTVHSSQYQSTPVYTPVHSSQLQSTPVHTSPHQSTPVHTSPIQSPPVHTSPHQSTPVPTSPLQSTSVYTSPLQSTPVYSSRHQSTPVYISLHQSLPVHSSPYQSTPVTTSLHQSTPVTTSLHQSTPVATSPHQSPPVPISLHQSSLPPPVHSSLH
ncbi:hypothetical protein ACOMHN_016273 [Nucella lapillus]